MSKEDGSYNQNWKRVFSKIFSSFSFFRINEVNQGNQNSDMVKSTSQIHNSLTSVVHAGRESPTFFFFFFFF